MGSINNVNKVFFHMLDCHAERSEISRLTAHDILIIMLSTPKLRG